MSVEGGIIILKNSKLIRNNEKKISTSLKIIDIKK